MAMERSLMKCVLWIAFAAVFSLTVWVVVYSALNEPFTGQGSAVEFVFQVGLSTVLCFSWLVCSVVVMLYAFKEKKKLRLLVVPLAWLFSLISFFVAWGYASDKVAFIGQLLSEKEKGGAFSGSA